MRKIISLSLALLFLFTMLVGCSNMRELPISEEPSTQPSPAPPFAASPIPDESPPPVESTPKVGVSMPTMAFQYWNQIAEGIELVLEECGYEVDLQFGGESEVPLQIAQIQRMIDGGCEVLIIAAIDVETLTEVFGEAKDRGIAVISLDRLIMDSDAVNYFVTFDYYAAGVLHGEYIRDALDLDNTEDSFNIELFFGDPDASSIYHIYNGAMSVLDPYLDSGRLMIPSGQRDMISVSAPWQDAQGIQNAQRRMEDLISSQRYSPRGTKLHAVFCTDFWLSYQIASTLRDAAGYTPGLDFPIIVYMDNNDYYYRMYSSGYYADLDPDTTALLSTLSMSVLFNPNTLASQAAVMADAIIKGEEVPVNDITTYDNRNGLIPSFLCMPERMSKYNYWEHYY